MSLQWEKVLVIVNPLVLHETWRDRPDRGNPINRTLLSGTSSLGVFVKVFNYSS